MDSRNYIEYELVDPVSNKRHMTESRDEAAAYFEKEWMVTENQVTICRPSLFSESKMVVKKIWNNNPEFEGV